MVEAALNKLLDIAPLDDVVAIAVQSVAPSAPSTTMLHVKLAENKPNVLALAAFLCRHAVNYALSRRRREAVRAAIENSPPGDLSGLQDPVRVVRDTFIQFNAKYPGRASEVGEVLAYCVAVHHLQAAQVAAKMSLKTSSNMAVHGLDGIHAKVDNGAMVVYFLEAKLSQSANDGVMAYAGSVANFLNGGKQYLLEYSIVGDLGNLDSLQGKERELALDFFDVLGHPAKPRLERSIGVICYSEAKLFQALPSVASGQAPGYHEAQFAGTYAQLLTHHQTAASQHLAKLSVDPNKCQVFFVAVPDVNELRENFYQQIGFNPAGSP